jgi:DNA-binding transcriptional LysR family regulator
MFDKAPLLQVETRTLSGGFPRQELESGDFDLAIAAYFENIPSHYKTRTVYKDRFVCVCAKNNSYLRTKLSSTDYLKRKHLQIDVPAGVFAPIDQILATKKEKRNIALKVGNFLTPAQILSKTDLLLTCPESLAKRYKEMYSLVISDLPFQIPGINTKMVWHEKNQQDPFHTWLRNCLAKIE